VRAEIRANRVPISDPMPISAAACPGRKAAFDHACAMQEAGAEHGAEHPACGKFQQAQQQRRCNTSGHEKSKGHGGRWDGLDR
jgi:hypothetical protein